MAGRTSAADRTRPQLAAGYAVFALWVVAPLAAGFGVVATRFAPGGDSFPVALGSTVTFGLLGGVFATAVLRRRSAAPPPSERPSGDHDRDAR